MELLELLHCCRPWLDAVLRAAKRIAPHKELQKHRTLPQAFQGKGGILVWLPRGEALAVDYQALESLTLG